VSGLPRWAGPVSAMIDEMMNGLPAKHHATSELTAEVSPKQSTFDFDLKSK
jgi:hypothetical protein